MPSLDHKGYQGSAAEEDGHVVVRILGIRDMISANASDAAGAGEVFRDLVDDYLATCGETGKQPDAPGGMVGEYRADYSPLTPSEIAAEDPELSGLYVNGTDAGKMR